VPTTNVSRDDLKIVASRPKTELKEIKSDETRFRADSLNGASSATPPPPNVSIDFKQRPH